jgi:hypothetical protein
MAALADTIGSPETGSREAPGAAHAASMKMIASDGIVRDGVVMPGL